MSNVPITVERAAEAVRRLINSHFGNDNQARCRIPADPENDDDFVAARYIAESSERIAKADADCKVLAQRVIELEEALENAVQFLRHTEWDSHSTEAHVGNIIEQARAALGRVGK